MQASAQDDRFGEDRELEDGEDGEESPVPCDNKDAMTEHEAFTEILQENESRPRLFSCFYLRLIATRLSLS